MRIFNTYGPNMHPNDGRVVSNFILQALRNEPITVYGDGSQTRSFCYVDDNLSGMIALMNHLSAGTEPVNIGNPHEITVKQLADIIIQLTGSKSKVDYLNLPSDDPLQRCPDISRAKELLNWEPKVELEVGLSKTIAYFDDLMMARPQVLEAAE
jgi:UDP-glucuronate decarboxylase